MIKQDNSLHLFILEFKRISALIIVILQYYFPFNNRKAKVDQDQVQEIKYSFFLCEEEVTDDEDRARFEDY